MPAALVAWIAHLYRPKFDKAETICLHTDRGGRGSSWKSPEHLYAPGKEPDTVQKTPLDI